MVAAKWVLAAALVAFAADAAPKKSSGKSSRSTRARIEAKKQKVYKERSTIARVARQAMPAVVSITTRQAEAPTNGEEPQKGLGSGFIIDPAGYILTSSHVIEGASDIRISILGANGMHQEYPARVVGQDEQTDCALLKIDAGRKLPTLKMGSVKDVDIADWLVVIGNPFGLSHSVSVGVVSYKGRTDVVPNGRSGYFDYLQTDASINPGNSGGPILDLNGRVIAIANAVNVAGQGIGFAIPIDIAKTILPQLRTQGFVRRGWMGISVQDLTQDVATSLGMIEGSGVFVSDVVVDGPAAKAGLRQGDVITGLDASQINRAHALRWSVASRGVGKQVRMNILRDGRPMKLMVSLSEAPTAEPTESEGVGGSGEPSPELSPEPELAEAPEAEEGQIGAVITDVDAAAKQLAGLEDPFGALVREVESGSALEEAGLLAGDVVLKVNSNEITSSDGFVSTIKSVQSGEVVRLFVRRGEQTLALAFRKP